MRQSSPRKKLMTEQIKVSHALTKIYKDYILAFDKIVHAHYYHKYQIMILIIIIDK